MNIQPIYLDYNATTPVDEKVLEVMIPFFSEKFGNASSIQHVHGWDAEEAVDIAKEQIGGLISSNPNDIIITSGATEAINLCLSNAFDSKSHNKKHIITYKTEHKAVLDCCSNLEKKGAEVTYLEVNKDGLIDLEVLDNTIKEDTLLVSIMYANNETGVLQPVREIGEICKKKSVLFFSDATQAVGKIEFNIKELNIDLAAFSAHKLYGPKGVGALYINPSLDKQSLFSVGNDKVIRPGTLNVPGIVGFGKACQLAKDLIEQESKRLMALRDYLEKELDRLDGTFVNGRTSNRLPHVTNVSFHDIEGSQLIRSLKGLSVSQGSACNSTLIEPSHVLMAMGISHQLANASLRISLGRFTTEQEVKKAVQIIRGSVEQMRMQLL